MTKIHTTVIFPRVHIIRTHNNVHVNFF